MTEDNIIRPHQFQPFRMDFPEDLSDVDQWHECFCRRCGEKIRKPESEIQSDSEYRMLCLDCLFEAGFEDGILNSGDDDGEHI